jgi:hypothetical protein
MPEQCGTGVPGTTNTAARRDRSQAGEPGRDGFKSPHPYVPEWLVTRVCCHARFCGRTESIPEVTVLRPSQHIMYSGSAINSGIAVPARTVSFAPP